MTEVAPIEPEVLVPLTKPKAVQLDKRIRTMAGAVGKQWATLEDLVKQAKNGLIHEALGYKSWPAYVADAVGGQLQLSGDNRQAIVQMLHGEGMSERAIVETTGVSKTTVHREISGGPNGPPDAAVDDIVAAFMSATAEECTNAVAALAKTPAVITGLDNKTYRKPKPQPPRRKPLSDDMAKAVSDLRRVANRITKLTTDDRAPRNREELKRFRWDIVLATVALREAVETIDGDEPSIRAAFELLCETNRENKWTRADESTSTSAQQTSEPDDARMTETP